MTDTPSLETLYDLLGELSDMYDRALPILEAALDAGDQATIQRMYDEWCSVPMEEVWG